MKKAVVAMSFLSVYVAASAAGLAAGKEGCSSANTKAPEAKSTAVVSGGADPKKAASDAKKLLGTMTRFEDKPSGVAISYPKAWKLEQPRNGTHIVRFKPADISGMSISLSAQDAFKNESLKDFVDETNEKAVKSGKDSGIKVSIGKTGAAGQMAQAPAVQTDLKYDMPPNPALSGTTFTALKGGKAYTMSYTSFASVHSAYMPVFDEMVKSLKIGAAPSALKERPRRMAIPAKLN